MRFAGRSLAIPEFGDVDGLQSVFIGILQQARCGTLSAAAGRQSLSEPPEYLDEVLADAPDAEQAEMAENLQLQGLRPPVPLFLEGCGFGFAVRRLATV